MSEEQVVDAEVVEAPTDLTVRAEPHAAIFDTSDPVQVIERATEVANALKRVVDQQGLIVRIQGKEHPLVEAWQTLGMMLGVTAVVVSTEPTTDRHGKAAYKAEVEARFRGEVVGRGDALCSTSESRWAKADDYAILSMSQTRATSKALKGPLGWVMKLAGLEPTPAEEMTFAEPDGQSTQPRSGSNIPSENQLKEIDRLAKQLGADDQAALMLVAYAEKNLTGGRDGSASKVISQLLVKDQAAAEARLVEFVAAAAKWNATLADAPADTAGL